MSLALDIWHLKVTGGEEKIVLPPVDIQITNIALGEEIADENSRTVVKLTFEPPSVDDEDDEDEDDDDDEAKPKETATTVLCALTPGKIEQASINLILQESSVVKFVTSGKNTVYLTGNYIKQSYDNDPSPSELYDSDDSEGGYDLREVSSDVEMHPDDLDGVDSDASRFEEVDEEPVKGHKRPRESDTSVGAAPAKAEKKNKKVKTEEGSAVPVESASAPKKEEKKDKKEKKEKTDKKVAGEKKTVAGGVVIQDVKTGTGPMAKKGNKVKMRYIGKLTNGKEFDKNTVGKPFAFHLGKGEVIKGWDEGIVGMQVDGERILTIPPAMAYGKRAQEGIPSNSTLVFEVKLLEIK